MKKKKKPLHLYVWEGVLTDYMSGVIFALAESEEKAREQVLKKLLPQVRRDSFLEAAFYQVPIPDAPSVIVFCIPKGFDMIESEREKGQSVPAYESWLYENPEALARVKQGLMDSAEGKRVYLGSFQDRGL